MPKVPISEIGTAMLGMKVARPLRRNRNTTMITSATAMHSVRSTSCSEARMVVVLSCVTVMSMAAGIEAFSCGSMARMLSTVSMMLASGCLVTEIRIAGLPLTRPALRRSSTESTTSPRLLINTGAPLRYATTRSLYCAAFLA